MILHCKECGKEMEFHADPELSESMSPLGVAYRGVLASLLCDGCADRKEANRRKAIQASQTAILESTLPERMAATNFQESFQALEAPYVRSMAEKIWRNRNGHLLVCGRTGSGKTSSLAFVSRLMMKTEDLVIRYYTLSSFAGAINAAKRGASGEDGFWKSVKNMDILILDEIVGRRAEEELSPAMQEAIFNLLDIAYTSSKPRIWIAGNIFQGSLANLFFDPAPIIRRLKGFRQIVDEEL